MNNAIFLDPRPQFFNGDLPASFARLSFYSATTSTLKNVYTSRQLSTPLDNPMILDANGQVPVGGIWMSEGQAYKVVLEFSDGSGGFVDGWTIDDYIGSSSQLVAVGSLRLGYVTNVTDIPNLSTSLYDMIYVSGYRSANDGGQGFFKWESASSATSDGGVVISPISAPSTGRWIRDCQGSSAIGQWWGVIGSSTPINGQLTNACNYALAKGIDLNISGSGLVRLSGDYTISVPSLTIGGGISFIGATSVTLSPTILEINQFSTLISGAVILTINPLNKIDLLPEWWALDYVAMVGSGSKGRILFTQGYNIGGTTLDFSGFECYFKTGSYLNSSLFVSNRLTFGIVGSDQGATNLFRVASGEPYPFLFKNDVFARWLIADAGNYLDANHTFICISATMNGTQNGKVIFDIDFIQRGNTTDTNYTRLTNIEFRDCTISSFGTNTRYKLFANSFNGLAFVTQATPIQPVPNADLKVSWFSFGFGFGASNATNNHLIFGDVAFFAIANNLEIDGQNLEIELLANTGEISATATAEVLTLKNMNIKAQGFKINIKTSIGSTLNVVTILNSRFLGLGVNSLCEIACKTQYSRLENCELKYSLFECKDSAYVQNNTFLDANIFNDSGVNVHILNNFCKITNGTSAFIYIGATLEPQQWRVIGNTYIDLLGGVAEMFDVGGRTLTIFNSFIECNDNFGGEIFNTKIHKKGTLNIAGGGGVYSFPLTTTHTRFTASPNNGSNSNALSFVVQLSDPIINTQFKAGGGGYLDYNVATGIFSYSIVPQYTNQQAIVAIEFSRFSYI